MVGREDAWSTNLDLWVVPSDGSAKPRSITSANPATDTRRSFSHDGSKLAYLAMARPGFESDRLRVVVLDWKTKKATTLTEAWDRSPHGDRLVEGRPRALRDRRRPRARIPLRHRRALAARSTMLFNKGTVGRRRTSRGTASSSSTTTSSTRPRSGPPTRAADTRARDHAPERREGRVDRVGRAEQFSFAGAKGDKVYGWLVKPPRASRAGRARPRRLPHPRRPARVVRRPLPLPMERRGLRRPRLRHDHRSISTDRPATARPSPTPSATTGGARRSTTS